MKPRLKTRSSGLLLHLSSLTGPHGIGDLGPEAYRFVDRLACAGQGWWQMLPVGPTGGDGSPYNSYSAMAGNPWLISLEGLAAEGLLEAEDIARPPRFPEEHVDFEAVRRWKDPLLRKAFSAFSSHPEIRAGFREFRAEHSAWIKDYALFCAERLGEPAALAQFVQYIFHRQWSALRAYAEKAGIGLIGDVPIYAAPKSADVWAHPEIFQLDEKGRPTVVAGVPPDYFSKTGQLWGNPLYRWDVLSRSGYAWWIARLRSAAERFDAVRLDHFIGFTRYWAVPAGDKTAERGRWEPGPGAGFFEAVRSHLKRLELIAEDLGSVTPEVHALRDRFELPGMHVLEFAFGGDFTSEHQLPHNIPPRSVVYTGTHDNDTVMGWFRDPRVGRERENALNYLRSDGREFHWDMIGAALRSPADTAIIPVQDILGLGSEARMNVPGVAEGNWRWRLKTGSLSDEVLSRLKRLTEESGRTHRP